MRADDQDESHAQGCESLQSIIYGSKELVFLCRVLLAKLARGEQTSSRDLSSGSRQVPRANRRPSRPSADPQIKTHAPLGNSPTSISGLEAYFDIAPRHAGGQSIIYSSTPTTREKPCPHRCLLWIGRQVQTVPTAASAIETTRRTQQRTRSRLPTPCQASGFVARGPRGEPFGEGLRWPRMR